MKKKERLEMLFERAQSSTDHVVSNVVFEHVEEFYESVRDDIDEVNLYGAVIHAIEQREDTPKGYGKNPHLPLSKFTDR